MAKKRPPVKTFSVTLETTDGRKRIVEIEARSVNDATRIIHRNFGRITIVKVPAIVEAKGPRSKRTKEETANLPIESNGG